MSGEAERNARHYAVFVRTHQTALEKRALHLSGNPAEARDLVQDTFERALRRMHTFAPGTNERAWLMTILTNLFLDRLKRQRVAREVPLAAHDVACEEPQLPPEISTDEVLEAVSQLAPDLRDVVELHDLRGLRYREVAERLAIPIGTVGTRLARARSELRSMLAALVEARR